MNDARIHNTDTKKKNTSSAFFFFNFYSLHGCTLEDRMG